MKKMKLLSAILLTAMALSSMVACSSSDDEDGGGVSYTESEIVELLTGKWGVSGDLKVVENETGKVLEGNYTGHITFSSSKSISTGSTSHCTRNDFDTEGLSDDSYMNHQIFYNYFFGSRYEIVKKDGKIYICIGPYSQNLFEIVSLNKNSLKLVLNQDWKNGTHVYMTVVSN